MPFEDANCDRCGAELRRCAKCQAAYCDCEPHACTEQDICGEMEDGA